MHSFSLFQDRFLYPWNLSLDQLFQVVHVTGSQQTALDFSDLYLDYIEARSWHLEDREFKNPSYSAGYGAGIRLVRGEEIGFASTTDLTYASLMREAQKSCLLIDSPKSLILPHQGRSVHQLQAPVLYHQASLQEHSELIQTLAREIDQQLRAIDQKITQVIVSLDESCHEHLLVRDDGQYTCEKRPMISLRVQGLLKDSDGKVHTGTFSAGGRYTWNALLEMYPIEKIVQEVYRLALLEQRAQDAPGGMMPVILGSGWPAVLIHEAVGHGIEGDFNRKKTSLYHQLMGQKVASEKCTIIDDGTIPHLRGSISIDDEGTLSKKTVLIEQGILKNYLFDRHNAALMGTQSTGSGRRESALSLPMPRMTNTYLAPGTDSLEDMISSVEDGLYAVNFSGGSVDITSGQFVFSAQEAYRIINGKIAYPVKNATLTGVGPQVLRDIVMVGSDFAHDRGIGTCGKNGQSVPVTVGQPSLKISQLVVGGLHETA